jgi:hypothetical protein
MTALTNNNEPAKFSFSLDEEKFKQIFKDDNGTNQFLTNKANSDQKYRINYSPINKLAKRRP